MKRSLLTSAAASRLHSAHGFALETKEDNGNEPPVGTEVKKAFDTFLKTFEDFKTKNDQELAELKKSMKPGNAPGPDAVTAEEVKKLNDALTEQKKLIDNLRLENKRPNREHVIKMANGQTRELSEDEVKHRAAWLGYMRKGVIDGLSELEQKALSVGSNPDGGYVVPVEAEMAMDRLLTEVSPIRQIATVRQISSSQFKKPFNLTGATSGWVGEASSRTQTDTPTLDELSFPAMELYAMPAATQSLLDDAAINMEQWLAEEVNIEFAYQEGVAFVTGNGVNKPMGFNSASLSKVLNTAWAHGSIGYIKTGSNTGFVAAPNGGDCLIDTAYALKAPFRANARWVMNNLTQAAVRKLKDSDGAYLWQPGIAAGQPASVLSYPVTEAEAMPAFSTQDNDSIAFGDFRRGYLIVDRVGVRVLRDPFSSKPYVLFYTTKRVGGGVQNYECIKLLRTAA